MNNVEKPRLESFWFDIQSCDIFVVAFEFLCGARGFFLFHFFLLLHCLIF